jgi:tRNA(Ile)-lysidine synthase
MRRKNLIVKRKVEKNLVQKNIKVKKIYQNFKKIISKNIGSKEFAVGVSGGADSLCLSVLSKFYTSQFKNEIFFLIVNHNLRKDSHKEALKVQHILKKNKIESKVLNWEGKVPKSNIQSNARNIRYSLVSNFCKKKKIKYFVTAHHTDDQIENFFIRLFRGSGLTGLSSMTESVNYNSKLKIIRPFLGVKKTDLQFVTLKYFKTYIKDPSNKDMKFLRVRVREYLKNMEAEGLNTGNIIKTINNLLLANKALGHYKSKALYNHTSFISKNKCLINKKIFEEEAEEIIFKSFSDILSLVSGKYYPPRSKKIINLISRVKKAKYYKSTLGGCLIEQKDNFLVITKENKVKKIYHEEIVDK